DDAAADGDARVAGMAGLFPRLTVGANLRGLLDVEGLAGLVVLERRALQVHAELCRPDRGRVGAGAPPDAFAQAFRERLETEQARRVGEHRARGWRGQT